MPKKNSTSFNVILFSLSFPGKSKDSICEQRWRTVFYARAKKKSRWLLRWQLAVRIWFANGARSRLWLCWVNACVGFEGLPFFVDPWLGAGFLPVKSPAWPGATGSSLPYLVIMTITDFCSVWGSFRYALSPIYDKWVSFNSLVTAAEHVRKYFHFCRSKQSGT